MSLFELKINNKKGLFILLVSFFSIFFCTKIAFSATEHEELEPTISDVNIFEKNHALYLSFYLRNGMPKYIEKVIKSGISVRYFFNIVLKKNGFLWDDELLSLEIKKTITFDNLKNKYFIFQNYPSSKILTIREIEKAKRYLLSVKGLKLIPLKKLFKKGRYRIEIKARCEKEKISLPFSKLIKLFSSFGFSTKTYEFEFTY